AASGTVVRADWDYQTPYKELFDLWLGQSAELGYTSPEGADFFGGQQIWIDNGNGIQSRYLHLGSIDPAVQVGATVERGQIIARVGNSGSPSMLISQDEDAHLHFEIRVGEGYVGEYLRPIEAREWLRKILR
ncbi:MAG TPA: M23 family metallopeptidase, partial [Anaerolineae bacterium]|nr:M23 family metallopeptidase [Anaerolineae bacterium]